MIISSFLLVLFLMGDASSEALMPSYACNYAAQICGGITIPYPFGMTDECGLPNYRISCMNSSAGLSSPYILADYDVYVQVLSFSTDYLIVNSTGFRSTICGNPVNGSYVEDGAVLGLSSSKGIAISPDNAFLVVGCGIAGTFEMSPPLYVNNMQSAKLSGSCSETCSYNGMYELQNDTSCKVEFPSVGAKTIYFESFFARWVTSYMANETICGYSTIYHEGSVYAVPSPSLAASSLEQNYVLKLSWGLTIDTPGYKCSNLPAYHGYACAEHSNCVNVPNIELTGDTHPQLTDGYVCECAKGYHGDGYRNGTQCQDIDECLEGLDNCIKDPRFRVCINTPGSFVCGCLAGAEGNGVDVHSPSGTGCTLKLPRKLTTIVYILTGALGSAFGVASLCFLVSWCWVSYKSNQKKAMYFKMNGGLRLQEYIVSSSTSKRNVPKLFPEDELRKATQNYAPQLKLGGGGHGTVYKGHLKDGTIAAIKKPFLYNQDSAYQFINEIIILSQVNHRNIVRVLGCCLETQTPLLVYEYVSNGTLYEHLHHSIQQNGIQLPIKQPPQSKFICLGWESRLTIAVECAEALAYLHSSLSTPVLHRDIKSSNVLLDRTLTPKICDFGISRVIPGNQTHVSTLFQGTLGYLDPEYFKTQRLNDKSDVYSFGVLLLELVTARKPIFSEAQQIGECHYSLMKATEQSPHLDLSTLCISAMQSGELSKVVDHRLKAYENSSVMLSICQVTSLAASCVQAEGCNRPTMREVLQSLRWINASWHQHMCGHVESIHNDATHCNTKITSCQNTMIMIEES